MKIGDKMLWFVLALAGLEAFAFAFLPRVERHIVRRGNRDTFVYADDNDRQKTYLIDDQQRWYRLMDGDKVPHDVLMQWLAAETKWIEAETKRIEAAKEAP